MPPIDIERLLRRVVGEVFGDSVEVTYTAHPKYAHDWRASLVSKSDRSKAVEIRATYEWFTAYIPELDVGTLVFEYDEDEEHTALRELSQAMRAYLRGDGEIDFHRSLFSRRARASVTIRVDDTEWVLGKRSSRISSI